ncbi:hypothetical protein PIROE2DRAFT_18344, partial [Piromyces sp. E2]
MLIKFNLYNKEELEKHSVLISNKSELIDNTTSYILDPIMPCKQCKKYIECPGHLGRIKLKQRIVHPLFVNILCKEITHICPICKVYKISNNIKSICCSQKILATTFGLHKINYINLNSHKNNKKSYSNMKSEYAFSFGKEWISINEIPSIVDSSNIVIHNNITSMYIRLLDLNFHYQNEKDNSNNSSYALR